MKAKKGIKDEQLAAGFERGIGALDELRVMQLSDGLRLQGAQNRLQALEYERFKRKYGKEHPRTLNAAAKIELGREHIQAISIVHTTASAPYPDPGNGWAVDGFVRNATGDPVGGVTVAAYDQKERWYEEFGFSCTDEEGYFSIVIENLAKKPPHPVFMRASKDKKLLASNKVQLLPEPESSDRVEIIISDIGGKGDCMPPADGKDKPMPPDEPVRGKDQPAPPVKKKPASADPAKEVRKKDLEEERQKLKKKKLSKPLPRKSSDLSAINGIGPQRVKKLVKANIKDVETFIATDNQKLIEILGDLDFTEMKKDARALLKKK